MRREDLLPTLGHTAVVVREARCGVVDHKGRVLDVGERYLWLRTAAGSEVLIPLDRIERAWLTETLTRELKS